MKLMTTTATGNNSDHAHASAVTETPSETTSSAASDAKETEQPAPAANAAPVAPPSVPDLHAELDPDMPFFRAQPADRVPPPQIPSSGEAATLSVNGTLDCAALMLQRIFASPAVRFEYYNRSRSWHKRSAGTGRDGGDYERQWLKMLADELPDKKGVGLNANDFGNIHQVMFLTLRRAMIAVTGHDPHPAATSVVEPIRSFHFIPNDTSAPAGTYNPATELGLPRDQP
jgi:hypothetical protein